MESKLKIKICQFGKKLGIKDIIEEVHYVKGTKNDMGDSPDDYVEIKIKEPFSKTRDRQIHTHRVLKDLGAQEL